jgi:CDGSH-type Zn-finger protein
MSQPEIASKSPAVMELEPGTYYWCACGRSADQPWCDGSHKACDIVPVAVEITEQKRYALCQCKHSTKGWMCDGSHKNL